jgi:hypothetical protein
LTTDFANPSISSIEKLKENLEQRLEEAEVAKVMQKATALDID